MLLRLHVRNFVLIDSLDIDFPEGLVIITGQTGAGKSVLLGALSLLSGLKADASKITPGADSCVVEADFSIPEGDGGAVLLLKENDLEDIGGIITLRRVVSSSGRSRCFVNDCPVPQQFLADISELLFDIHSQHNSLILKNRQFQLSVLDAFAGVSGKREECASLWREMRGISGELERLKAELEDEKARNSYNGALYRELETARLRSGEMEELEEEQKLLSNAGQVKEALSEASALLSFSDDSRPSPLEAIREARKQLQGISRFLSAAEPLCERLDSVRIELDDIVSTADEQNSAVELSAERLAQVESRLSLIYGLLRKHGCRSVEELLEKRDSLAAGLEAGERLPERISGLEAQLSRLQDSYDAAASLLSEERRKAAPLFCERITGYLKYLELERAVFGAQVVPVSACASGRDSVTFTFSASGSVPVELENCISGGEMSRIMLSLKALMAGFEAMPTLIFDEIDTGVSGSVADKMGSLICEMGKTMQVVAITHLPQVAAKGNAHFTVIKDMPSEGQAVTRIVKVEGEDRVMEIARLLSGASITPEAVANARSLLSAG